MARETRYGFETSARPVTASIENIDDLSRHSCTDAFTEAMVALRMATETFLSNIADVPPSHPLPNQDVVVSAGPANIQSIKVL